MRVQGSPKDLAWAAGLFEGEGCATYHGRNKDGSGRPALNMRMTDEDVVRRFHSIVRLGRVYGPYTHSSHRGSKPFWQWQVTNIEEVAAVIAALLPQLGARRRARCMEVLAS